MNLIEFKGVGFGYPEQALILSKVNLSLNKGDRVLILGSNGSGKSTLAQLTAGLLKPQTGTIIYSNLLVPQTNQAGNRCAPPEVVRPRVGIVFQDSRSQIVGASVEEDLAFGLTVLQLPPKQIAEKVAIFLQRFGLSRQKHFNPAQLSGGELRRLALASILITEPDVLILDEPLAMLDHLNQKIMLDYINKKEMAQTAILWLDQDLKSIRYTQKWMIIDSYGQIQSITEQDLNSEAFLRKYRLTPTPLQYLEWQHPERVFKSLYGPDQIKFTS